MGILDKFKRKPKLLEGEKDNAGDPPENSAELAEIVQNEKVEPGIPQNLEIVQNKSIKRFVFLGFGIFAVGLSVAGLIAFSSGSSEETADPASAQPNAEGNTKPKDFSKDKEQIERDRLLEAQAASAAAASAASAASASAASAASGTVTPAAASQPVTTAQSSAGSSPQDDVLKRRLDSDLLFVESDSALSVASGSGGGQSPSAESGGLFSDSEGSSKSSGGDSGSFASRLNPTVTVSVSAQQRGDLSYLLTKGTNIPCALDTRIITTQPGITRCIVTKDVYSANGRVVLIERGSKVIGEQTAAMLQGQARVFVLWNEVETPAGVKVSLRSPGSGPLGEAGQGAYVNYHFWQRFGGALMISLINDIGNGLTNSNDSSGSNNNITYENTSDSAQEMATEVLKNSINIPPTGTVNQGALLNIMVARDVNFDKVYEVVDTAGDF